MTFEMENDYWLLVETTRGKCVKRMMMKKVISKMEGSYFHLYKNVDEIPANFLFYRLPEKRGKTGLSKVVKNLRSS